MNLTKGTRIAIGIGILLFVTYLFYLALPSLLMLASNIIYLSGAIVFVIVCIYAFFRLIKWMSK